LHEYLKLVPFEAATNSSGPGSSKQSKLTLKYSELVIYFPNENSNRRKTESIRNGKRIGREDKQERRDGIKCGI
jgi:hypothetical protein